LVQSAPGGLFQIANEGEVAFDEYAREILRLGGVSSCRVEGVLLGRIRRGSGSAQVLNDEQRQGVCARRGATA
jgi:hypothetical protein